MDLKKYLRTNKFIFRLRQLHLLWRSCFPMPSELGGCGKNTILDYPITFESKESVFLEDNTKIRSGCHVINSPSERFVVKKYSVIAANCTVITNNHRSTVTIPQILLGCSHINDKSNDIIIEEDVWVGANVTLLSGAHLGRGCIVGAGSIVSKPVPPYAVVVGSPVKIIAKKFDLEDIIKHEEALYPQEERMTRHELEKLFAEYFVDKKTFGTAEGIDDCAKERIERFKKLQNYIEPQM